MLTRLPILSRLLLALLMALTISPAPAQKERRKQPQIEEEKKPWWDAPQPRFSKSELGGVFSGTIEMRGDVKVRDRTVYKAIAVRRGEDGSAGTVLFDTEMLRMACAIPDRPVMFNTYRDGLGGAGHWVGDPYVFVAESGPGWADEDGSFEDPRNEKAGPLPKDWAHYRGYYLHGEKVVFSYTVHDREILDRPWIQGAGENAEFFRQLEIGPSSQALRLRLCQDRRTVDRQTYVLIESDGDVQHEVADGHHFLAIPPRDGPTRLKILITMGGENWGRKGIGGLGPKLKAFTKGGPARFLDPLTTKGELGDGDGAYVVDTLTPPFENPEKLLLRFGGHDFFSNGDIAACTIDGDIWRISGIDDDLHLIWKRYATGLFQPLGLKIVDDKVHVLGRDQITRLHDLNGDDEADFYECFNNQCKIGRHVHEFATGLETDPEGNFYFVKGHGARNSHAGTLLKVAKDGSTIEVVATGFRWPNGSGAGPNGELTVADQQGTWVPSSRIDLVKPGGFYGFMNAHHRETPPTSYDGPLCWIPHRIDNSCGGQAWVPDDRWGPFQGHMVHLSYGKCALFLVLRETIAGIDQAGVYKFPVKFQSGAMRARFSLHDGQLYVSGLKGWQTSGAKDGCLQRVRFTGTRPFMPKSLHIHQNGIRIGFTQQLDRELAEDLDSWRVEQWNYRWTKQYGSKEYKVTNPDQTGHDPLHVLSATLLDNQHEVFLRMNSLAPVMQMKIHFDLESAAGRELIGDLHNTIHALAEPFTP